MLSQQESQNAKGSSSYSYNFNLIDMKSADRNSENAILSITETFRTQRAQLFRNTGSPSERRKSTTLNVVCTVATTFILCLVNLNS